MSTKMAFPIILGVFMLSISWIAGTEHINFLSDEYIANLNKQGLPWKAGRNFPADLTQADVERMFGRKPASGTFLDTPAPDEPRVSHLSDPHPPPIPRDFDARIHFRDCSSIISVIPNQGACASSYAFAIPSVASDRLCIASKGKVKKTLSAEYMAACCKVCRFDGKDKICSVGASATSWLWVKKRGLVTGGGYKSNDGCQPVSFPACNHTPYPNSLPNCTSMAKPQLKCHTRCTNEQYSRDFFQDKVYFRKYYWLTEEPEDIQREILKNGPVLANMYISSDLLSYKSGVYLPAADSTVLAYAQVKIIGWGEEEFHPYWIVVSTFGEQFGENGTFRILRGHDVLFIESLVNAALPRDFSSAPAIEESNGMQH